MPMNRQCFLETLLLLPVGLCLVHCSSDVASDKTSAGRAGADQGGAAGAGADAPAAEPTRSDATTEYSSSDVGQHFHTFKIADDAIGAPSAGGLSGETSAAFMHAHSVSLTTEQLKQLALGVTVSIVTSSAGSHTHVFTFRKIS